MYDIDNDCLEPKRSNTTTLDEMYMLCALSAASNSKDPSTQVGACYVSEDGSLLSMGCNHVPPFWDEDKFPWGTKKEYGIKNNKYTYIIHAEMAGIQDSKASIKDYENSTLYVTLFPCINCAKLIATLKVKKLVYLNARKGEEFECANILLSKANVEVVDFRELSNNLIQYFELDMNEDEKNNIKIRRPNRRLEI